ncbi:hypothetical protein ACTD5D_31430 [Nocardia takedensis]|uniref:hypothetical protein n=1 Tax=Nocardia takedensis TaxID=259390 RepID=UPI003F774FD8
MRIIRPDDNHDDHDDDRDRAEDRGPDDPDFFSDIGDEVEDYLAHVLADIPPLDPDEVPAPTAGPRGPKPPKRGVLHLVPTDDPDADDPTPVAVDPDTAIAAGRGARKRMVRGAAGSSALVVAAATVLGWGESFTVVGPLAVYGTGWVGYLCWNAALRPSFPDTVHTLADGIGRGVTATVSTVTARSARTTHNAATSPSAISAESEREGNEVA